ncbi:hypothetical protein SmJEL517_g04153 [Synchytrium microbalum]|uniref:Mitochondrial import inner membrane translocase subunit n=1 Tax=Synchytrium microbalum TaxID=1806994 RepID=A0A507C0A5_9FUNG|nr:uncharacterized protein SmJEL517_g04153 [Synchytrium microbalum]TPX32798.1 hypothetical protein SmJEL517_g04153 [Synchytrium microbalum]
MAADNGVDEELKKFIETEQRRATFQSTVHQYTEICFDKCLTKVKASLDKSDEACVTSCVERFLDTTMFIVQRVNEAAQNQRT